MPITLKDVDHIALLARIGLTEEEREALRADLETIVDYVAQLASVDTSGVEPTSSVVAMPVLLRADRVVSGGQAEAMTAVAPDRDGTYLRVPKIIE
jgi:aspartyl-tRNA(Asn)/glutamyl-tRNA(Gln) amidotransferase subunit C